MWREARGARPASRNWLETEWLVWSELRYVCRVRRVDLYDCFTTSWRVDSSVVVCECQERNRTGFLSPRWGDGQHALEVRGIELRVMVVVVVPVMVEMG